MNEQIDSDFLDRNQFEFLHHQDNSSISNLFDFEEDEETREFFILEQSLMQEKEDDDQLFTNLNKQVEQIKLNDQLIEKQQEKINQNEEPKLILRKNKKISFDENSYANETKASHLISNHEMKIHRPLTIYIPNAKQDLNLLHHLTTLGHDIDSFKQKIQLTPTVLCGYLWKECSNLENNWRKRYFCFDREKQLLMYFKSLKHYYKQKRPKDVMSFEEIKNVYPDHLRNVEKIPKYYANFSKKTRSIFIVKTTRKDFVLSTFSASLMRIWLDSILTGAQAYENYF